ncbi:trichohyalin-like [Centruroides sculpturatus]|uniref:trichohyalin-like n=1 Tax=Centruroides sculpturatus TaxID=218467 RepID=UPI000C6E6CFE|nr:trichohyalin-like [Centruroides sculpturatus]
MAGDEKKEITQRFYREGLDVTLPDSQKLIHMWRWLADAESNCVSMRYQLDKLHHQQNEELKEIEKFAEHVKKLANERYQELQEENKQLRRELDQQDNENGKIVSREIRQMILQEGLTELANLSISELFAYFLVERKKIKEQLEQEQERRCKREQAARLASNLPDSLKLCSPEIQKILEQQKDDYEEEIRHQQEMMRHVKEQLRQVHEDEITQLETEKEHLTVELNNAKRKIEELVRQVAKKDSHEDLEESWIHHILNGGMEQELEELKLEKQQLKLRCQEQQRQIRELSERVRLLERSNKQLELDNETLAFKLSEALSQFDDLEDQLRKEKTRVRRDSLVKQLSAPENPSKGDSLYSFLDNRTSSAQHELSFVEQTRKLKTELTKLQDQLLMTSNKLEAVTMKYQQKKTRHKDRVRQLKDIIERERLCSREKIEELKQELKLVQQMLNQEQEWKKKLEKNCQNLQDEKRHLLVKLIEKDEELKERIAFSYIIPE